MGRFKRLMVFVMLSFLGIGNEVAFAQQSEDEILAVVRRLTARQGELDAQTFGIMCMEGATLAVNLRHCDFATELMEKGRVHAPAPYDVYAKKLFVTELMVGQSAKAFALLETMSLKGPHRDDFLVRVFAEEPTIANGPITGQLLSKIEAPERRRSGELRRVVHAVSGDLGGVEHGRQLLVEFGADSGSLSDRAWCVALAARLRDKQLLDQFRKRLDLNDEELVGRSACVELLARIGEFESALTVVDQLPATEEGNIYRDLALTAIAKQVCLRDPANSEHLFDTLRNMCDGDDGSYTKGNIAEALFLAGKDQVAEVFLDDSAQRTRFSALCAKLAGLMVEGKEQEGPQILRKIAENVEANWQTDSMQGQIERSLWLSSAFYQAGQTKECRYWADRAKNVALQYPDQVDGPLGYGPNGVWVLIAEAASSTQRFEDFDFAWTKIVEATKGRAGIGTWGNPQGKGWEALERLARLTVRRFGAVEAARFLGPAAQNGLLRVENVAHQIGTNSPDLSSLMSAASVYPRDRRRQFLMLAIQSLVPQIVQSVSPAILQ